MVKRKRKRGERGLCILNDRANSQIAVVITFTFFKVMCQIQMK